MSKVATSNSVESQEFTSGSLLDQIALQTSYSPTDESYDIAKQGIVALISNLLDSGNTEEAINKQLVDRMIAELDKKMSLQIDEILHHPDLQKIVSSWSGLKLLIDITDFR